ncbi:4-oxalocrotonate tautomerase [Deltaproteobacteria bacterium Smac51]|nr:4-oxalocrotonate tautomerase [Deltaproteobacteria bacterium Smac51]
MPVITMESSKLSKEQKTQLVKEFTDSAARILNMPKETFVVYLKENELENIGTGGKLLSDVKKE